MLLHVWSVDKWLPLCLNDFCYISFFPRALPGNFSSIFLLLVVVLHQVLSGSNDLYCKAPPPLLAFFGAERFPKNPIVMETKKEADIKRKLKRSRGKTKSKMIALADSIQFKSNPRAISIFISNPSMDLSGLYKVVQVKPIWTPLRHPVIEEESFKQNAPKLLLPVLSHTDTGGANEAISDCRCVCTSWAAGWLYICVFVSTNIFLSCESVFTPALHPCIIP